MLNIEKYKKILIDTEVINTIKLAVQNDKPVENVIVANVILEERNVVCHM